MTDEEIKYMKNKIEEIKTFLDKTKDKEIYIEDLIPCMIFNEKDVESMDMCKWLINDICCNDKEDRVENEKNEKNV